MLAEYFIINFDIDAIANNGNYIFRNDLIIEGHHFDDIWRNTYNFLHDNGFKQINKILNTNILSYGEFNDYLIGQSISVTIENKEVIAAIYTIKKRDKKQMELNKKFLFHAIERYGFTAELQTINNALTSYSLSLTKSSNNQYYKSFSALHPGTETKVFFDALKSLIAERDYMKPIIFNSKMVQAIKNHQKRQIRRVINIAEPYLSEDILIKKFSKYQVDDILYVKESFAKCDCGECELCSSLNGIVYEADYLENGSHPILYTHHLDEINLTPSLSMAKNEARIFLRVAKIRGEQLHDISIDSINKEGFPNKDLINEFNYNDNLSKQNNKKWAENIEIDKNASEHYDSVHKQFYEKNKKIKSTIYDWWIGLWNSTTKNKKYKWKNNPYVLVYEYEIINILN